jgi:hypothetical protein
MVRRTLQPGSWPGLASLSQACQPDLTGMSDVFEFKVTQHDFATTSMAPTPEMGEDRLNEVSKAGWELVTCDLSFPFVTCLWQRPVVGEKQESKKPSSASAQGGKSGGS